MAEQSRLVVVSGRGVGIKGVVTLQAGAEVREATTGQVVTLPRVMAVAAPRAVRPESRETRRLSRFQAAQERAQGTEQAYGTELAFYRKYTEGLLRRYMQMTMEAGRVSSLMGREVIGGRASSYRIHGFDDAVIFRLDVEKCLQQLQAGEREVIQRIALQEYTHVEVAELIGVSLRTVGSRYAAALDRLTAILLRVRLLEPLRGLGLRPARCREQRHG